MIYNKLYFNHVEVIKLKDGSYSFTPNFTCPNCNKDVKPIEKIFTKDVSSNIGLIISQKSLLTAVVAKDTTNPLIVALSDVYKDAKEADITIASELINYNSKVEFIMPCCGNTISLYVAVYQKDEKTESKQCISVNTIPSNWYESDTQFTVTPSTIIPIIKG